MSSPRATDYNSELEELEISVTNPRKYIDYFLAIRNDEKAKPNVDTRYAVTVQIINSEPANKRYLNIVRFFNFLEFTSFSSQGYLNETDLLNIAFESKDNEYYSVRTLIKSIQLFGNSSTEDFLRTIVPKIGRFLNQKLLSELLKQAFAITDYKLKHFQNAKVYVYIVNELIKRADLKTRNEILQSFFTFLKADIESDKKDSQILNSIARGNTWGWGIPFQVFLENIGAYKFDISDLIILIKWIVSNYIADEKENTSRFFISEFKKYLLAFVTAESNKSILEKFSFNPRFQNLFSQNTPEINSISLYVFDYLSESRKQELIRFYENNFTEKTDPYFITKIKTKKLKDKIINLLDSYEMLADHPGVYSFDSFIKALVNAELLNKDDIERLIGIIRDKYSKLKSKPNYFRYSFYNSYDSKVSEIFRAFSEIKRLDNKKYDTIENSLYEELKSEYMSFNQELFSLSWLYDANLQNFKKGFMDMLSVLSYLYMEEKYCYVFDIALSKIIVQDSQEFEAVLENFLIAYENGYGNHVFENPHTRVILQELLNKLNKSVPYCYDDLFIKRQIGRLSKILQQ